MGDTDPNGALTLGLMIDETKEVPDAPVNESEEDDDDRESKALNRLKRLADTMTDAHDRRVIEAHEKLVCYLPAKGYGTTEFRMSEERRQALVNGGKQAMKEYLAAHPS